MGLGTKGVIVLLGALLSGPSLAGESFAELAERCAPAVHPQTLRALVRQESAFNPLAIGINGPHAKAVRAGSRDEAVAIATRLIAAKESVDLGLGQINSANLGWLGLSVAAAFEPCANLAAAAKVLTLNYLQERDRAPSVQVALDRALSRYNTGHPSRGIANGYVAKVRSRAGTVTPPATESQAPTAPNPWDPFALAAARRAQRDVFAATTVSQGGTGHRGGQ